MYEIIKRDVPQPIKPVSFRQVIVKTPSPLDIFVTESIDSAKGSVTFVTNDIAVFFNQQRLASLGQGIVEYVAGMLRSSHPDPLKGYSDEILLQAVKSRYIQSTCDVNNWVHAVSQDLSTETQAVIAKIKEMQSKIVNPDPNQPTE